MVVTWSSETDEFSRAKNWCSGRFLPIWDLATWCTNREFLRDSLGYTETTACTGVAFGSAIGPLKAT